MRCTTRRELNNARSAGTREGRTPSGFLRRSHREAADHRLRQRGKVVVPHAHGVPVRAAVEHDLRFGAQPNIDEHGLRVERTEGQHRPRLAVRIEVGDLPFVCEPQPFRACQQELQDVQTLCSIRPVEIRRKVASDDDSGDWLAATYRIGGSGTASNRRLVKSSARQLSLGHHATRSRSGRRRLARETNSGALSRRVGPSYVRGSRNLDERLMLWHDRRAQSPPTTSLVELFQTPAC